MFIYSIILYLIRWILYICALANSFICWWCHIKYFLLFYLFHFCFTICLLLNLFHLLLLLNLTLWLLLFLFLGPRSSSLVNFVDPSLIEIDQEDYVISEATESMQSRHGNDKAEKIINDGVQESVEQSLWGHVLHWLEAVVYVKLRSHLDESKGVDAAHECINYERVPALMFVVEHWINSIANHHWEQSIRHISHSYSIVLLRVTL